MEIIEGDIFSSDTKYLVHQCNCVSQGAAGIAAAIFEKFPYSDIYSCRPNRVNISNLGPESPGSIIIKGDGNTQRFIVNLMGQVYPGAPRNKSGIDSYQARVKYFKSGLAELAEITDLETVAFPYLIGCGMASGDWNIYSEMIENFSKEIYQTQQAKVYLYRLAR